MTPEDGLFGFSWVIKDLATTLVRVVFASHAEHSVMTVFLVGIVELGSLPILKLSCLGCRKYLDVALTCLP